MKFAEGTNEGKRGGWVVRKGGIGWQVGPRVDGTRWSLEHEGAVGRMKGAGIDGIEGKRVSVVILKSEAYQSGCPLILAAKRRRGAIGNSEIRNFEHSVAGEG